MTDVTALPTDEVDEEEEEAEAEEQEQEAGEERITDSATGSAEVAG